MKQRSEQTFHYCFKSLGEIQTLNPIDLLKDLIKFGDIPAPFLSHKKDQQKQNNIKQRSTHVYRRQKVVDFLNGINTRRYPTLTAKLVLKWSQVVCENDPYYFQIIGLDFVNSKDVPSKVIA